MYVTEISESRVGISSICSWCDLRIDINFQLYLCPHLLLAELFISKLLKILIKNKLNRKRLNQCKNIS